MAQAPLVQGLRAAASEASSGRIAGALSYLADQIERGRSLHDVLADDSVRLPEHVRGLVSASIRTGRIGPALDELIEHQRNLRAMVWGIWGTLTYPLVVLAIAAAVLSLFMAFIVPQFEVMFRDFQMKLPAATESLLIASRSAENLVFGPARYVLIAGLGVLIVIGYLCGSGRGGAAVQRALSMMPILGPLWAWTGASSFLALLSLLLEHHVPLSDALRLTGAGMRNAALRRAGQQLAVGVASGQRLSRLIQDTGYLPASTVPMLEWGEKAGALAEASRTLADIFADRMRARSLWLRSTTPPVIYVFVLMSVGFAITSLFLPLVSLIQGLS
jgi:type IV pilus assembly protein PilC